MASNNALKLTAAARTLSWVTGVSVAAAAAYGERYISWGSALSGLKMSAKLLAPR